VLGLLSISTIEVSLSSSSFRRKNSVIATTNLDQRKYSGAMLRFSAGMGKIGGAGGKTVRQDILDFFKNLLPEKNPIYRPPLKLVTEI
jgi:hypothetical protein